MITDSKPQQATNDIQNSMGIKVIPFLNTILFGPPGTGKTYRTIDKALEMLGYDSTGKSRSDLKTEFEKRIAEKQIVFTTFHQSMNYEDFIEGIKPYSSDKGVKYRVEPGIFRKIAYNSFDGLIAPTRKKENDSVTFDQLYAEFLESIRPFAGKDEYIFETLYKHPVKLEEIKGTSIIVKFKWQSVEKQIPATQRFSITKEKIEELFEGGFDLKKTGTLKEIFAGFFQHNLSVYYAGYKKFYEFVTNRANLKPADVEGKQSISYMDLHDEWNVLLEEDRKNALNVNRKNYVLIIDEINRGNVSQIFGELITLIEENKRIGREERLEVELPYSGEKFSVPPNLYIIGTMNTADRSVEALDTALRRRFMFEEISSDPQVIKNEFEYTFLNLCVQYHGMTWESPEWKSIEKDYIDVLDPKRYTAFQQLVKDNLKTSMSYEEYKVFWDNVGVEVLTVKVLERINERIETLLNRDSQIGHAYFIGKYTWHALKVTFHKNILPLLQEYFYGDYGKIGLVVGVGFVEKKPREKRHDNFFAVFEYEDTDDFLERPTYILKDIEQMNNETFRDAILKLLNVEKSA